MTCKGYKLHPYQWVSDTLCYFATQKLIMNCYFSPFPECEFLCAHLLKAFATYDRPCLPYLLWLSFARFYWLHRVLRNVNTLASMWFPFQYFFVGELVHLLNNLRSALSIAARIGFWGSFIYSSLRKITTAHRAYKLATIMSQATHVQLCF